MRRPLRAVTFRSLDVAQEYERAGLQALAVQGAGQSTELGALLQSIHQTRAMSDTCQDAQSRSLAAA